MRRRTAVVLSFQAMAKLLHLRDGLSVTNVAVNPAEDTVEFFVDGDTLAPVGRRETIPRTRLLDLCDWEMT